jgi:hypothetical protein
MCSFDFLFDPRRLKFVDGLEIVLKAIHAGNAGSTVSDVVDDFVGTADDFAWSAM